MLVTVSPNEECRDTINVRENTISSPSYPSPYPSCHTKQKSSYECKWMVMAPIRSRIKINGFELNLAYQRGSLAIGSPEQWPDDLTISKRNPQTQDWKTEWNEIETRQVNDIRLDGTGIMVRLRVNKLELSLSDCYGDPSGFQIKFEIIGKIINYKKVGRSGIT